MLNSLIRLVAAGLMLAPVCAFAAPPVAELPKTGQTLCYGTDGTEIPCTGTGQDGEKQAGVAWPTPRFTANGDGTITDKLTDLVWLQNADCFNVIGWQSALDNARTLANGACGLNDASVAGDWRLPNRVEMLSLVNYQQPDGAVWLDSQGFTNGVHGYYWTSDTYVPTPAQKWVVHSVGDALTDVSSGAQNAIHALYVRNLAGPVAEVTPASADFGNVGVNVASAPQSVTIANSGKASLIVSGMTVTGADSAMFAINPGDGSAGTCGSLTPTIAGGANCTVTVVFTPTSTGAKTATFSLASNSLNTPVIERALTGTGIVSGFNIAASVTGGGSIVCTPGTSVQANTEVTCTVTPAQGNRIASVTVDGASQVFSDPLTYTHAFGPVSADHTINASFVPVGASGSETLADAIKAFQAIMGKTQLSDQEKTRYDVAPLGADGKPTPDGVIDVGDVVILLRKIAGVISW